MLATIVPSSKSSSSLHSALGCGSQRTPETVKVSFESNKAYPVELKLAHNIIDITTYLTKLEVPLLMMILMANEQFGN